MWQKLEHEPGSLLVIQSSFYSLDLSVPRGTLPTVLWFIHQLCTKMHVNNLLSIFSIPTFLITPRIDFGEKQGQGTQGFTAVELMPIVTGKWNGVVSWKLTAIWIQRFPQLSLSKMMGPLGLQYKTDVFLYGKT